LRATADARDGRAAQLFAFAARHPDNIRLFTEVLSGLTRDAVNSAVDADMQQAAEVAHAMNGHVHDPDLSYQAQHDHHRRPSQSRAMS